MSRSFVKKYRLQLSTVAGLMLLGGLVRLRNTRTDLALPPETPENIAVLRAIGNGMDLQGKKKTETPLEKR